MKSLLSYMLAAGLGLWIATLIVAGISVTPYSNSNFLGILINQPWKFFILFGIILGLLNYFVKPILNLITLPLRIITLGLFSVVINMGLIWIVDYIFVEFKAPFFWPLFWVTAIIWGLEMLFSHTILNEN